jgi:4-amino-4-deoxychorismate lyase
MSRLIESIKIENGRYKNLAYHALRMKRAWREIFNIDEPFDLADTIAKASAPAEGIYKCRLIYDSELQSIEFAPYNRRDVASLMLVSDDNIAYPHKFEDRRKLDDLFTRRANCDDVLIIKNGFVTDTSYSNIAFRKGNDWFTPSRFLLAGTMRQQLIDEGTIREAVVKVEDLPTFETFKLINALLEWNSPEVGILSIRNA